MGMKSIIAVFVLTGELDRVQTVHISCVFFLFSENLTPVCF